MEQSQIFSNIAPELVTCCHRFTNACRCRPEEAILRNYINGSVNLPGMTTGQRLWCIEEIMRADHSHTSPQNLSAFPDQELAIFVLDAWMRKPQAALIT